MAELRRAADRQAEALARLGEPAPLMDLLPDPVVVLDAGRSVLRHNEAARRVFGDDMPAVLRHPTLRAAVSQAVQSGAAQVGDLTLPGPLARELRVHVRRIEPALRDGGQVLLVLSDRTQERAIERGRADFIANASHELRTPLASLVGFIETLRGPAADDPPAQLRFLGIMAEQAGRMQRLVEDLLALSRIEMTERQPPREQVDVAGVVRQTVAGLEPQFAAQEMALELEVPDQPVLIPADADQLVQVVQNLLDNALKYGAEGKRLAGEAVGASGWGEVAGAGGCGADGDGSGMRDCTGASAAADGAVLPGGQGAVACGRGHRVRLAIVKHIVNRHRGQLVIQSERDAGTTVRVWLPAG